MAPSLSCLSLRFFEGGHCDPHLKFISGALAYIYLWLSDCEDRGEGCMLHAVGVLAIYDLFPIHPVYVCVRTSVAGPLFMMCTVQWVFWRIYDLFPICLVYIYIKTQWLGGEEGGGGVASVIFSKLTLFMCVCVKTTVAGPLFVVCVCGGGGGGGGGGEKGGWLLWSFPNSPCLCVCVKTTVAGLHFMVGGGGGGEGGGGGVASVILSKFTLFMCVSRQQRLVPSSLCAPSSGCQSNPRCHSTTCQKRMDSWRPWPVQQTWTSWLRSKCCFDFRRRSQCRCNWTTVNLLAVSGLWHKLASCPVDLHHFSRGIA